MDLRKEEVSGLANFMGHADKIHKDHYRIPVVSREIGRISGLLEIDNKKESSFQKDESSIQQSESSSQQKESCTHQRQSSSELSFNSWSNNSSGDDDDDTRQDSWHEQAGQNRTEYERSRCVSPRITTISRRSWSTLERSAVTNIFSSNISAKRLPKTSECLSAIKNNDVLKKISPAQVKAPRSLIYLSSALQLDAQQSIVDTIIYDNTQRRLYAVSIWLILWLLILKLVDYININIKFLAFLVRWTTEEKRIMREEFKRNLEDGILPGLKYCESILNKYECLSRHREAESMKAWVNNTMRKKKKKLDDDMQIALVDIQGFHFENDFHPKEVTIELSSKRTSFLFKPLVPLKDVKASDLKCLRYVESKIHGIPYHSGYIEYTDINKMFKKYLFHDVDRVYIRGSQKARFLQDICKKLSILCQIVDVAKFDGTGQASTTYEPAITRCPNHRDGKYSCTETNVAILHDWLYKFLITFTVTFHTEDKNSETSDPETIPGHQTSNTNDASTSDLKEEHDPIQSSSLDSNEGETGDTSVVNFNSQHRCQKCTIVGEYSHVTHSNYYPNKVFAKRTDESFRLKEDEYHHKTDSVILKLPINMIDCFPVADSLHLIDLGVMKRLLTGWRDGSFKNKTLKWPATVTEGVTKNLLEIKLPKELHRAIRGLDSLSHWKGLEYRNSLLYNGATILKDALVPHVYEHFLGYCLGGSDANSWFLTKQNDIVYFEAAAKLSTGYLISGKKLSSVVPLFQTPINPSILKIYIASSEFKSKEMFKISDIKCKLVHVVYKNQIVFTPLLHTLCK
nr:unnamed protein product [Callosobruchus analis]